MATRGRTAGARGRHHRSSRWPCWPATMAAVPTGHGDASRRRR